MAGGGVKLDKEWADLLDTLDGPKFEKRLGRALQMAHGRIGRQFQGDARRAIRSGDYAPNSPMTVILKGSSKPLVDNGDLALSITYDQPDEYQLRLGVMRSSATDKEINVALVLHEGATIDVAKHPKVRMAVWAKMKDSMAQYRRADKRFKKARAIKGAAALMGTGAKGGSKDIWVIPARPFILAAVDNPVFERFIADQYAKAVKAAFRTKKG